MSNYTVMFSKIADDLPQVVNPNTGEYFDIRDYKWGYLITEDGNTYWDDNGGYGYDFNNHQDSQGNVYFERENLCFIPTVAYFGTDNIKLEKGLYLCNNELNSSTCNAVRLVDINTGGDLT